MPWRESIPAILRTLHVPLGIGHDRPLGRGIVHHLPVPCRGPVQEIVEVGIIPPLSNARSVGHQGQNRRCTEALVPKTRDGGDIGRGDGLNNEHG